MLRWKHVIFSKDTFMWVTSSFLSFLLSSQINFEFPSSAVHFPWDVLVYLSWCSSLFLGKITIEYVEMFDKINSRTFLKRFQFEHRVPSPTGNSFLLITSPWIEPIIVGYGAFLRLNNSNIALLVRNCTNYFKYKITNLLSWVEKRLQESSINILLILLTKQFIYNCKRIILRLIYLDFKVDIIICFHYKQKDSDLHGANIDLCLKC